MLDGELVVLDDDGRSVNLAVPFSLRGLVANARSFPFLDAVQVVRIE